MSASSGCAWPTVADAPVGYLVATNVLSNQGSVETDQALAEWLRRHAGLIRLSVISVAEMRRGLVLLEGKVAASADRKAKAREKARLARKQVWYAGLTLEFADRIEPIDLPVAERWAAVSVRFPSLRDADKAIAATALARGYAVATRNLRDFRHTGLHLVDPFDPGTWDNGPDDDPVASLLRR